MSSLRRGGYLPPGHPSYEELAGKIDNIEPEPRPKQVPA